MSRYNISPETGKFGSQSRQTPDAVSGSTIDNLKIGRNLRNADRAGLISAFAAHSNSVLTQTTDFSVPRLRTAFFYE